MKKFMVVMIVILSPVVLCSMERKNNTPAIGQRISSAERVVPLEKDPERNDMVLIGYNNQYHWGLVRSKIGSEFSVIEREEVNKWFGVLLPLERLYMLVDNEKNNEESGL